jgi:putative acetyltransferase
LSFVAVGDGGIVGAVLAGHDGRRGYIHHLAVHPDWRRHGIGRRLIDRCLGALRDAGINKCHTFVFRDNPGGIAFWKSLGWTPRTDLGLLSRTTE